MKIETLAREGFGCPCCGDGVSYPNKFVRAFMKQLNVDKLLFEYSSDWTNGYFYDCYFEYKGNKYVIEVDGLQHFKKSSFCKTVSLDKQKERDKIKTQLAFENNIELIRIDARKSELSYIKQSINNSKLCNIFRLEQINWEKCEERAMSNLAKEVCQYAEKLFPDNYNKISEYFQLSKDTIHKYIVQGVKYGWCSQRVFEKMTCCKKVVAYDKNNNYIDTFPSLKMCSIEMGKIYNINFNPSKISENCKELTDSYNGFIFKFAYNVA